MTDRDRLIELLDGAEDLPTCQTYAGFADYLLANGVIVPPCKVGDKIYRLFPKQGIVEMRVKRIQYGSYGLMICAKGDVFPASCFGETVFLTREEAERKLRKEDEGK